jgi:RNA polymerase sigma factor for flagellar operon FliA
VTLTTEHAPEHPTQVDEMVRANWSLVGRLVSQTHAKVPPHVSRDELMSAGLLALTMSAMNFDPDQGAAFSTYATIRVRGALLDELRSMDSTPRSVRALARDRESATARLIASRGCTPRTDEVAAEMGVPTAALHQLQADLTRANPLSLDALPGGFDDERLPRTPSSPEALALLRERADYVRRVVETLPARLRLIITGYYFEERTKAEIAAELGVSASLVSRLCREALRLLRAVMDSELDQRHVEATG